MKKKSVKSPTKNWGKKVGFIALGLVAVLIACGIYLKQTNPKKQLIRVYGAEDVAFVESAYRATVATHKLCERSWKELAQKTEGETYETIVKKFYDLHAELFGRELFEKPRELINEYRTKFGPKTIEETKVLIESTRKPTDATIEETYDRFCYNMLWESMNKVDELRATYTIIPEIQEIVQKELDSAVAKYQARGATGIIMESKTGQIISMVSVGQAEPMQYVYQMGSHFKVFNTVLAYENGLADKEYTINVPYVIRDKKGEEIIKIQDVAATKSYFEKHNMQKLSADDIFLNSCNVGSVQIALDLPDGAQREFFHRVKLDDILDLGLQKTGIPLLHRKWGVTEQATAAFGHGLSITPMHMIASLNAVINGEYVYPTLKKTSDIKPVRIVSADIAKHIREILHKKAELSTGSKGKVKHIGMSTSTAEKKAKEKPVLTSAFVAFPIDDPQYSMFILLDDPKATKEIPGLRTSAWNVVPTAGNIVEKIEPILMK